MKTVISWVKKNEATAAALVAVAMLIAFAVACQPTAPSITDPSRKVTRAELGAEVIQVNSNLATEKAAIEADLAKARADFDARISTLDASREAAAALAEQAEAELARQEQALAEALLLVEGLVQVGAGPYAPLALSGLGILTLGLGIDNRRKDGVIKGQQIATKV